MYAVFRSIGFFNFFVLLKQLYVTHLINNSHLGGKLFDSVVIVGNIKHLPSQLLGTFLSPHKLKWSFWVLCEMWEWLVKLYLLNWSKKLKVLHHLLSAHLWLSLLLLLFILFCVIMTQHWVSHCWLMVQHFKSFWW